MMSELSKKRWWQFIILVNEIAFISYITYLIMFNLDCAKNLSNIKDYHDEFKNRCIEIALGWPFSLCAFFIIGPLYGMKAAKKVRITQRFHVRNIEEPILGDLLNVDFFPLGYYLDIGENCYFPREIIFSYYKYSVILVLSLCINFNIPALIYGEFVCLILMIPQFVLGMFSMIIFSQSALPVWEEGEIVKTNYATFWINEETRRIIKEQISLTGTSN
jgi:hypothetical protein